MSGFSRMYWGFASRHLRPVRFIRRKCLCFACYFLLMRLCHSPVRGHVHMQRCMWMVPAAWEGLRPKAQTFVVEGGLTCLLPVFWPCPGPRFSLLPEPASPSYRRQRQFWHRLTLYLYESWGFNFLKVILWQKFGESILKFSNGCFFSATVI